MRRLPRPARLASLRAEQRLRRRFAILLVLLAAWPTVVDLALRAGTLASVVPAGASTGITIFITGTGFNTTAANNEVTFTHTGGVSATATGTLIQTVNAT